ncbi:hypothetical protein INR49_026055 [Caranx melampygus]|nr:hypothetical protein INR49_026055 [Caranx melampygus]
MLLGQSGVKEVRGEEGQSLRPVVEAACHSGDDACSLCAMVIHLTVGCKGEAAGSRRWVGGGFGWRRDLRTGRKRRRVEGGVA